MVSCLTNSLNLRFLPPCMFRSLSRRSKLVEGMDEQKSNCEENDSEPTGKWGRIVTIVGSTQLHASDMLRFFLIYREDTLKHISINSKCKVVYLP